MGVSFAREAVVEHSKLQRRLSGSNWKVMNDRFGGAKEPLRSLSVRVSFEPKADMVR